MWLNFKGGCTLLKQTLADLSDEEESIEPKFVGVHSTDKQSGSMKLYIPMPGLVFTRELTDAHSWNKLYRQMWWRGVHRSQVCGCAYDGQMSRVHEAREQDTHTVYDGSLAIELIYGVILSGEMTDAVTTETNFSRLNWWRRVYRAKFAGVHMTDKRAGSMKHGSYISQCPLSYAA